MSGVFVQVTICMVFFILSWIVLDGAGVSDNCDMVIVLVAKNKAYLNSTVVLRTQI